MQITIRFIIIDSHRIMINIRRAVNEIIAPIDDIIFHVVYVSG